MRRTRGRIPAHYIVGADGSFEKILENEWVNVGATQKEYYNDRAIQIEIIWDFNQWVPSDKQYEMVRQLKAWLFQKYWPLEILRHWPTIDAKNCPGVNFNMDRITDTYVPVGMYVFNISKYYSPMKWQEEYFSSTEGYYSKEYQDRYVNYSSWYERDVCMNCWCKEWGAKILYDCETPADWRVLHPGEAMKAVACPKEFMLWTKFFIDWIWEVVCRDRWWTITTDKGTKVVRLDLRMGYGETWFSSIKKNPWLSWIKKGRLVK